MSKVISCIHFLYSFWPVSGTGNEKIAFLLLVAALLLGAQEVTDAGWTSLC